MMCSLSTVYTGAVCTLGQYIHWGSIYIWAAYTLRQCCTGSSVYTWAVCILGPSIRYVLYPTYILGSLYSWAVDMVCGILAYWHIGQCVHWSRVYTGAVCTLGQLVHWGSVYTGAVCTLRHGVHWGSVYTKVVFTVGQYVYWDTVYSETVCTMGL